MASLLVRGGGYWKCSHHSDSVHQSHPTVDLLLPLLYLVSPFKVWFTFSVCNFFTCTHSHNVPHAEHMEPA